MGYEEGLPIEKPMQRVAVAFLFAIETAMRSSEILMLTAASVNYKAKFARLPMTKNGTARNVPLSSRAVKLLKMLPAVPKGEPLFALSASSRDSLFRKARDRSQIPDVTFHDTRHEAITRLAKKLQPLDLARMTGHRNISELMTYYDATATDIAARLGRAPSTIRRELRRNGGPQDYLRSRADQLAWTRALRPKECKLVKNRELAQVVASKLRLQWSPEQIAGWLKHSYAVNRDYLV